MSTNDLTAKQRVLIIALAFVFIAAVVSAGLYLRKHAPGNLGNGFLTGAGIAILGVALAWWRAIRRPQSASTFERAWTQSGDERDDAVLTRALAVVGLTAIPLTGVATIVLAVGGPMLPVLAILNFALIGVLIIAFALINRRS